MFTISFEISQEDQDRLVVSALKEDMKTAHRWGDFKSFEGMYETLVWYDGHVNAHKHRMVVLLGED